jgi:hypothetical protein
VQLTIKTEHGNKQVEAIPTAHPELAINENGVVRKEDGIRVGSTWNITHIGTGLCVVDGILTLELAHKTVEMFIAKGTKFPSGDSAPAAIDLYQTAMTIISETYFEATSPKQKGVETIA